MADMREMFSSSTAMTPEEERRFMERQAKQGNEMLQLERNIKKLKGKGKKKKEKNAFDYKDIGMAHGGAVCGRPTGQGYGKARKG
tara:strand:- start:12618 stop:12872 length:255 start_codon:yes stop_codon:yes gene_type:complete